MVYASLSGREKSLRFGLLAVIVLNAALLWLFRDDAGMQVASFALLALWPMVSWSLWLPDGWGRRLVAAAALVLLLEAVLALLLSYLPGEIQFGMVLGVTAVFAIIPLVFAPPTTLPVITIKTAWPYLVVFFIALALRLPNLGYSEFQGDEAVILLRAAAIITGDDAELFLHQKGPIEILQPLLLWQLSGEINEMWARALFTWASVLAALAVLVLGWQWFGRSVGVLAGVLLAVTGFGVAFGRIVQYQSFVMLWGALALYFAVRYARHERRWDLVLTAVFLGGGLLAHYDAVLVVPAIAWALLWHSFQQKRFAWRDYAWALAAGSLVLAVFYVPFVLSPNFSSTGRYLLQDRIGVSESTGIFSWSGTAVWRMITLYNSSYFIIGLGLFIVLAVWRLIQQRQGMTAFLYFIVPVCFYLFIVVDPRTHVYTFFPGAVILAAVGIMIVADALQQPGLYRVGWVILGVWLGITAVYIYIMFIDSTPERMRTWSENRPALYWMSWDEPPLYGLFGFPHQAGWRMASALMADEALPYASNEEQEITKWYLPQMAHTHCDNFNTFIVTENTQDPVPYNPSLLDELFLQQEVVVNGRSSMRLFGRQPVASVTTHDTSSNQYWHTPDQALPEHVTGEHPLNIILGNQQVALLGYDINDTEGEAGTEIHVTLYWQALTVFDQNYQTYVHLYSDELINDEIFVNGLIAQHDGTPECGIMPTVRWEPGKIIADPHKIILPDGIDVAQISIYAGMYNLITGQRLTVPNTAGNTIFLLDIAVEE